MKVPLIFITYGFTKKICSWTDIRSNCKTTKVPIFDDLTLAGKFAEDFKEMVPNMEPPQPQICTNNKYAVDILKLISISMASQSKSVIIIRNPVFGEESGAEYDIDEVIDMLQAE